MKRGRSSEFEDITVKKEFPDSTTLEIGKQGVLSDEEMEVKSEGPDETSPKSETHNDPKTANSKNFSTKNSKRRKPSSLPDSPEGTAISPTRPESPSNGKSNNANHTNACSASLLKTSSSTSSEGIVGPILYEPGEMLPNLEPHVGSLLEVHVLAQHLTLNNEQIRTHQLWGTDIYTDDSDVAAIIFHTGSWREGTGPFYALVATFRILPGATSYEGSERHGVISKSWERHGVSLKLLKCDVLSDVNPVTEGLIRRKRTVQNRLLAASQTSAASSSSPSVSSVSAAACTSLSAPATASPMSSAAAATTSSLASRMSLAPHAMSTAESLPLAFGSDVSSVPPSTSLPTTASLPSLTPPATSLSSISSPTPQNVPFAMSTAATTLSHVNLPTASHSTSKNMQRSATSNPSRRPKKVILNLREDESSSFLLDILPDTILQSNLSNEPCFKYDISLVCDRGLDSTQWTSYKLKKAVLYVETATARYELSRMGTYKAADGNEYDTYRWALVLNPFTVTLSVLKVENVPLQPHRIKVIFENLDWNRIEWGANFVKVNNVEYKLEKLFWFPISKQKQSPLETDTNSLSVNSHNKSQSNSTGNNPKVGVTR